jgi:mannose-6-phosphate isomerase-like protein (cupin superfamily)
MKHLLTFIIGILLGSIGTGITIGKNLPGDPTTGSIQTKKNYMFAQLDEICPKQCPCGDSRRAFVSAENPVATIHMVNIKKDSQVHYHKKLTEIYLILEGTGHMELDGDKIAVKPMSTILIKPGCRHRAAGQIKIINIPVPAFDPTDEWFD